MKNVKVEQVFGSFWLGRTRRGHIEKICNAYLEKGYSLKEMVQTKARRYLIFPFPVILMVFEIDKDKMSKVDIKNIYRSDYHENNI